MSAGWRNSSHLPRMFGSSIRFALAWRLSLLVVLLGFSSCEPEFGSVTPETTQLRTKLIKEFHEEEIKVLIQNSTEIDVTFIDSTLNDLSQEERLKRARETVFFINRNYAGIDQITGFWVSFQARATRFLVVPDTRGINLFLFDKNGTLTAGYDNGT